MLSVAAKAPLLVAVTVDVEEEGLFSGRHDPHPAGLENLRHLERLAFVTHRFGLPLTLLATYPVLQDPASRALLLTWRDGRGAELGAHLHLWNTPPLIAGEPWQAYRLPAAAQRAKLEHLLHSHAKLLGRPARSFRMGRFELTPDIRDLLPGLGVAVDSSLVPWRWQDRQGPPLAVASDPYLLPGGQPGQALWEAPLTVLPLWPAGAEALQRLALALPQRPAGWLLHGLRYVGVAGVQPTMFSAPLMRLAARLHLARGGRVLTLFLHSSELMPGGSPAYPSERAVDGLLAKLGGFLHWLTQGWPVRGLTLSQLPAALGTADGGAP